MRKILTKQLMPVLDEQREYAEAIISTINEAFLILNKKLLVKTANEAFYRIFKLTDKDIEGKLIFDIQDRAWNIPKLREFLEDIIPKRKKFHGFELVHFFPRVGEKTIMLNAQIVHLKIHCEDLILLTMEDITKTHELLDTNSKLERSNSELKQFAYVASHDLQEPLRKIITFSNVLSERYNQEIPEDAKLYLNKIISSTTRMSKLIKDLLNFSQVMENDVEFVKTDLNKIVKEGLADFEVTINQKQIALDIGKLPVIDTVPLRMQQLFHNLISNACKFSKDESPELSITASEVSEEEVRKHAMLKRNRKYTDIIIKDNGIGFEQQYAEKIFIIFQRLHGKQEYTGTGIGLALCKKIVEYHNGTIFVKSKEGVGSEFHIILPIKQSSK